MFHHATGARQAVTDAFAQGTQTARDATKPYADSAADKAQSAKDSLTPNQGTTGTKSMSGPGSTSGGASSHHFGCSKTSHIAPQDLGSTQHSLHDA